MLEGVGTGSRQTIERREIRVVSTSDACAVHIRSQSHIWVADEATSDGGTDTGPDSASAFLGALLSCMTYSFKAATRRRKISIEHIEGHLHATPSGHVKDITLSLEVWGPDSEEQVLALLVRAERGCCVSGILKSGPSYSVDPSVHLT